MWRSLPMMRRYLEANRRARSGLPTGYREPNLLANTVCRSVPKAPNARAEWASATHLSCQA